MFSKLFPSKELKKFKDILNKLEVIYRNPSFNIVKKRLEDWAIKNPNNLKKILTQDIDYYGLMGMWQILVETSSRVAHTTYIEEF